MTSSFHFGKLWKVLIWKIGKSTLFGIPPKIKGKINGKSVYLGHVIFLWLYFIRSKQ